MCCEQARMRQTSERKQWIQKVDGAVSMQTTVRRPLAMLLYPRCVSLLHRERDIRARALFLILQRQTWIHSRE